MNDEKIKFGIIGAGYIGKRHALMIQKNEEAELIAFCDTTPENELGLDEFAVPCYASVEEFYSNHPDIDVICIATPNGLHTEQAIQALENDKHVVVEKPLALTKAGCEMIIYKGLDLSKKVFCVMQNRYSPPSIWLKDVVNQGILGKIYIVQINCYWNRDERYYKPDSWHGTSNLDGGTLFTQFSHFIDMMYWLFGDITNIKAKFSDFSHQDLTDFEDSGMISFDFVKGGMGCINYSTSVYAKNLESSITIIAEKGSVKVGGQYMNEVEYCNVENYTMPELPPSNPPNDYGPYKGSAANHHFIFENVVDVLKGRTSITTNALEGMKVVEIIERIYALKDDQRLNS